MISIGSAKQKCWISSIVELPTFYPVGSILRGAMYAETTMEYEPIELVVQQNRDVEIRPGLTKYKLEVMLDNELYDVVGIAQERFDPVAINTLEVGRIGFYPIFIHAGRSTYLFIEAINDLFTTTGMIASGIGTNTVMSPLRMIERIDDHMYPGHLPTEMYDARFARIQRPMGVLDILMTELNSDSGRGEDLSSAMEQELGVLHNEIPLEIQFLSNVRSVGQLRNFLNPYGNMPSDIARAAMCSRQNWSEIQSQLMGLNALPNMVGDVYMTNAEDFSYTGRWLSAVYTQDMNDFTFSIEQRIDARHPFETPVPAYVKKCDTRNNFHQSFERIGEYSDLMDYLDLSFSLCNFRNKKPNIEIEGQRSWFEDIVIRDRDTGQILVYVDMVYWMLACADGLVNTSILDSIDGRLLG